MDQGFACVGRSLYLSARRSPDKIALIEIGGASLTYRALNEGANRVGRHLIDRGVGHGDNVAVLSDNSLDHVVALYALAKIGAVPVVLDPKWTEAEIARTLAFFDCKLLIVDAAYEKNVSAESAARVPLGMLRYHSRSNEADLLGLARKSSSEEPQIAVRDHDVFSLMLTSGTTGLPKGCIRTHRNVEIGCMNGAIGKGIDEASRELVVVPIYYGSGRSSVIGQIWVGGTVYVASKADPERIVDTIERETISAIALAPTTCRRMLQQVKLESYDLRCLKVLRKAGSPFPQAILREMMERLTPNIYQGYASTESGGVTLLRPEDVFRKPGSSGRPRWGVDIRIVDGDGSEVGRGGEGEIAVRGPNVCQGYYKNPEEEAKVFRDGWYYTGDIGRLDEDDHLYVVGRLKDIIKTGSINVSPREVENALLSLGGIEDAAVVGVPDLEWGELIKAFVVIDPNAHLTADDILAHCRSRLAAYKLPKQIEFTREIERNALGKLTAEFRARAAREAP
jgi:acyl-CoA synthetase (AMP-forming)/AMP-acid ligase II